MAVRLRLSVWAEVGSMMVKVRTLHQFCVQQRPPSMVSWLLQLVLHVAAGQRRDGGYVRLCFSPKFAVGRSSMACLRFGFPHPGTGATPLPARHSLRPRRPHHQDHSQHGIHSQMKLPTPSCSLIFCYHGRITPAGSSSVRICVTFK